MYAQNPSKASFTVVVKCRASNTSTRQNQSKSSKLLHDEDFSNKLLSVASSFKVFFSGIKKIYNFAYQHSFGSKVSVENTQKNRRHIRRISRHQRMIFRVWVYCQRNSPVQLLLLYPLRLHMIPPCSTQDGVLQNTAWLNYYQLSRFERVRPLCRLFVHWAAGRVLCKTMLEVSLSTGNEKHSHRITELLSNTIVECIDVFFAVSFIWT